MRACRVAKLLLHPFHWIEIRLVQLEVVSQCGYAALILGIKNPTTPHNYTLSPFCFCLLLLLFCYCYCNAAILIFSFSLYSLLISLSDPFTSFFLLFFFEKEGFSSDFWAVPLLCLWSASQQKNSLSLNYTGLLWMWLISSHPLLHIPILHPTVYLHPTCQHKHLSATPRPFLPENPLLFLTRCPFSASLTIIL